MVYDLIDIESTIDSDMWFRDKKVVELERKIFIELIFLSSQLVSAKQLDSKHKTTGSEEKTAYAINSSQGEIEMNE